VKALADLLADGLHLAQLPAFVTELFEDAGYRVLNLVPDSVGATRPAAAFYAEMVAIAVAALESNERVAVVAPSSFVKRSLGAPLRLTTPDRVIDTSGCFLPDIGHPTVILLGGREHPTGTVAVVLGLAGEPTTPRDPAQGRAWQELVAHWDDDRWHGQYFQVLHPGVAGWAHAYLTRGDAESLDRALDTVRVQRDALAAALESIAALDTPDASAGLVAAAMNREAGSTAYGVEYALREVAARARTALEGVRRG